MSEWLQAELGAWINLQRGYDITRAEQNVSGQIPVVSSAGVASYHDVAKGDGPGVIIGRKGTLGRVHYVPGPFWPHDTTLWVQDFKGNDERFIYYALSALDTAFLNVGSASPTLNRNHLHPLPVRWPRSVVTQRAIAEVLGALDDKIAANDRIASTATDLIRALARRALETSPARARFFEVFDVDFGEAFKGASFTEPGTGRPLIRIRDLKTFKSQVWTTEMRARETVVRPGDVLVGMDAEFRATWWRGAEGLLNQRVCRVRGRSFGSALTAMLLEEPLRSIERAKTGTTVIHLNKRDLESTLVAVPSTEAVAAFELEAEPVLRHRVQVALESVVLATTRDALLPLLMSGKVRVRDAEKIVGGVV